MHSVKKFLLLAAALLSLTACGSMHEAHLNSPSNQKVAVVDPSDEVMRASLVSYLKAHNEPVSSQYEYVRKDLTGDGRRDAIVMLESPFYSWCNLNGCKMLVFKASDKSFAPIAEIAPVRGPLLVSESRTNGWRDLVIRISGRDDLETKNVDLKFDGRTYPPQPDMLPAMPAELAMADINGTQIFP
jgi:hypothetical protein